MEITVDRIGTVRGSVRGNYAEYGFLVTATQGGRSHTSEFYIGRHNRTRRVVTNDDGWLKLQGGGFYDPSDTFGVDDEGGRFAPAPIFEYETAPFDIAGAFRDVIVPVATRMFSEGRVGDIVSRRPRSVFDDSDPLGVLERPTVKELSRAIQVPDVPVHGPDRIGSTTLDLAVAADDDDGFELESDGSMDISAVYVYVWALLTTSRRHGAVYVASGSFPAQSGTVDVCHWRIVPLAKDDPRLDMYFDDQVSAPTLTTTSGDITNRTLTTASVGWVTFNLGQSEVSSPSLVTPMQELVDDYSLTTVVGVFKGRNATSRELRFASLEHSTEAAAIFHLEYTGAAGGGVEVLRRRIEGY